MRTIPSKYKASDPELKEYASMLRKACEDLKSAQARSLEYAVYAGKVVAEIKEHLKTSTTLLTFKKFLVQVSQIPRRFASGPAGEIPPGESIVERCWRPGSPAEVSLTLFG